MRSTRSIPRLIVLLWIGFAIGCAVTPEDRWYQQREALTTANHIYLAHVPNMSDQQVVHYGKLLQTARASLNQVKEQLPEGGGPFDSTLNTIEQILLKVIAMQSEQDQTVNNKEATHDTR
ncbi:hypothetical protein KS4_10930 [Poriferisphaera corsica]|uniref:Lipoprotein n=1 Tax=Poriferisphaera corsica TaxID=2528020 RepID=A0A517YS59_9BACT|nr:hypothetical protein [Poriferisphaera corsica]QDU33052.1 hypothetical protein KS4_10930 [Poriferisphaera corsica]